MNFQDHFKRASCSNYKWRSDLASSKLSLACFSLNARWRDPCSRHSSTFLINSNLWSIVNGGDEGAASKSRRIPGSRLIKERLLWATSSRWILHASRLTADHTHLHIFPHLHHQSLTPTRQYWFLALLEIHLIYEGCGPIISILFEPTTWQWTWQGLT